MLNNDEEYSDSEFLLDENESDIVSNDIYNVTIKSNIYKLNREIKNKKVYIEFNYNLFIYDENNVKIKDISYYDIINWAYGCEILHINYREDYKSKDEHKLIFKCENLKNIIKSLKKNINYLVEIKKQSEEKD